MYGVNVKLGDGGVRSHTVALARENLSSGFNEESLIMS
jgi:hypothetical protein